MEPQGEGRPEAPEAMETRPPHSGRVAEGLQSVPFWPNGREREILRVCYERLISFDAVRPRPLAEWREDIGPVIWWRFPLDEPPYVGSPLDCDWPEYHTHWTPIIIPLDPAPMSVPEAVNLSDRVLAMLAVSAGIGLVVATCHVSGLGALL